MLTSTSLHHKAYSICRPTDAVCCLFLDQPRVVEGWSSLQEKYIVSREIIYISEYKTVLFVNG